MEQTTRPSAKVRRVIEAGAARGLDVRPVSFTNETRTAADAAREIGCEVGQIVKTLVFEAEGEPVLLLVSGSNRVDLARAAAVLGVDRIEVADATRAKAATGYSIGATPPLGHDMDLRILMDEDLFAHDEVSAAAGATDSVFPAKPTALQQATDASVVALAER